MLSDAQLVVVKADILANPDLNSQAQNSDGAFEIARLYSLPAVPAFYVWKSSLSLAEATEATSPEATNWNWTGAGFITRSVGERDAWREIWRGDRCNPSLANVRGAFQDILSGGTQPAPANRSHLLAMAKRRATRIEKLLATGAGTQGTPATMGYEGQPSYQEIEQARALP